MVERDAGLAAVETLADETNGLSGLVADAHDVLDARKTFVRADLGRAGLRRQERTCDWGLGPTQLSRPSVGEGDHLEPLLDAARTAS